MKNVLLKWITHLTLGINLMWNWEIQMYSTVTRPQRPIFSLFWSRGQYGELKTQNNSNTKVQSMQTNNWLANNYHLSMFYFFFCFFLFDFFLAFNDWNWNASCNGSQLGFEIATIQICPKNIQTVRLVEMLRPVSSFR